MSKRTEPQNRFEIAFGGKFSANDVDTFLDIIKLDRATQPIVFELWKIPDREPFFTVKVPESRVDNFTYILEKTIPNATLRRHREDNARRMPDFAYELKMTKTTTALFQDRIETVSSGILVNFLSAVGDGEAAVLQFLIFGRYEPKHIGGEVLNSRKQRLLDRVFSTDPFQPKYAADSYKARYANGGFMLNVRLGICAPSKSRAEVIKTDIERGFQLAEVLGSRNIVFLGSDRVRGLEPNTIFREHLPKGVANTLSLSSRELAGLIAWPCGGIELGKELEDKQCPVRLRAPLNYSCSRRIFAQAPLHGGLAPVGLSLSEATKHLLVLGSTGVGKSNTLGVLCVDDILNSVSTLFIDPKSDTVNEILSRVPEKVWKYVVVIRFGSDNVIGINPFDPVKRGADKTMVADSILKVFRDVSGNFWGPQIEHYLKNALRTMAYMPEPNLLLLDKLLTNSRFREEVVARVTEIDPLGLGIFWDEYENKSPALRARELAPVRRRVIDLIGSPRLQAILGQTKSKFDFSRLFTERMHVLVALNGTLEGNDAKVLGQLISAMSWNLTLSRTQVPKDERIPVSVYIDELQDYMSSPDDSAGAFSQARAMNVGYTVACQYLSQLNKKLRESIMANVQNIVAFRIQDEHDASLIENSSSKAIDRQSLMRVPRFGAYFKTEWQGEPIWMSVSTSKLPDKCSNRDKVLKFSEHNFGRPRDEVVREIKKLLGLDKKEARLVALIAERTEACDD